jgi:NADH-quinone oxidoreductase subunit G
VEKQITNLRNLHHENLMTKQVTLTIDSQQVTVPEGTLIVDAAKKIGIDIPVFCYHPKMEPVGMCRMCLVEIGRPVFDRVTREPVLEEDGTPKIQFGWKLETACTVPVSEGMVVVGMSDKVKQARKDIIELLLTSHPLDCPICDKGGECPLQNQTMEYGASDSRFLYNDKQKADKRYPLGDLIILDRERCIQCARCIRFQGEIAGDAVLEFYQRGRSTDIVTFSDPGFDSYWSGNTTDICPVGALTTVDFRFGARAWELKQAASICTHCPAGCNLTVNVRREAKAGGKIVIKRIMPRQNEWVNEIWICDKGRFAHHFAESKERLVRPLIRRDGKLVENSWEDTEDLLAHRLHNIQSGLLTLVSGRLPNEDLFNLRKLTEQLGGKIGFYTHMAGGDLVGQFGLSSDSNLADLGEGDTIVVVASDLEEEAPIWYLRVKAATERGTALIVINPRPTKLDRYATEILRYTYSNEVTAVQDIDLPKEGNAVVFFGSEGLGLDGSAALANACADLLQKTGHTGTANNGLVGVWQRCNEQGAWDIGLRPLGDLKSAIEEAKVLYIIAADPAGDDETIKRLLLARNENLTALTVVQDLFLTETAKIADVVLPALGPTEREGTFTTGERRVQRFYPASHPRGEAKADFDIAAQLGTRQGINLKGGFPSRVFDQLSAEIEGYGGLSYQKLAEITEQWPIIGRGDVYYGGTGYENKSGLGIQLPLVGNRTPTRMKPAIEPAGKLIAVPVTKLYDHGTMIIPSKLLHPHLVEPFIALNPDDANAQKATDGMTVNISVNDSYAPAVVIVDQNVPAGFALVPRSSGIGINQPTEIEIKVVVLETTNVE